jgi:hypothetical protein
MHHLILNAEFLHFTLVMYLPAVWNFLFVGWGETSAFSGPVIPAPDDDECEE